ncbi:hypothetical protein GLYMA_10G206032v4 [Glycine max]|nr:hypothetical protein GLYMA_10G206032v4 [Glycine max]KAH1139253.1 hypothetical protein GYH30_028617 [Glycine max]
MISAPWLYHHICQSIRNSLRQCPLSQKIIAAKKLSLFAVDASV